MYCSGGSARRDRVDAAISHLVAAESELLSGLNKADQERLAALLRRLSIPEERLRMVLNCQSYLPMLEILQTNILLELSLQHLLQ